MAENRQGNQNPVENIEQGQVDEQTRREVERIREKQARGEELTMEEAGKLGGAARTGESGGRKNE